MAEKKALETEKRKASHIDVCLNQEVEAMLKTTGFEDVDFIHESLPELNWHTINTKSKLFSHELSAPIIVEGMTGGFSKAEEINKALATAAQEHGIAMGLGSQRAMIENSDLLKSYYIRDVAPDLLLFGNIGIIQLRDYPFDKIESMLSKVEADALAVHMNALQEIVQKEGDKNFESCLKAFEKACDRLSLPVFPKETGAGINKDLAKKLESLGAKAIDVSGSGGTSWSAVETYRKPTVEGFWDWGISTAPCVAEVAVNVQVPVIASGGIRSGLTVAKAIALGASFAGGALPFLKAWDKGGVEKIKEEIELWKLQLKTAMFLTASKDLSQLKKSKILITGKTAEILSLRDIDARVFASR